MPENQLIGSVTVKSVLTKLSIVSDTATTSSSGSDNWQFDAYKNASTARLSSAKTTSGAEIAANTEYNLGTLNATNLYLAAGDTLRIQVTKNGTPTDLSGAKIVFQAHLRKDLA